MELASASGSDSQPARSILISRPFTGKCEDCVGLEPDNRCSLIRPIHKDEKVPRNAAPGKANEDNGCPSFMKLTFLARARRKHHAG